MTDRTDHDDANDALDEEPVVAKRADTRKFAIGVALIIVSLIMGKIVLVPLLTFPGNLKVMVGGAIYYAVSWVIIIIGVFLAGREGYRLAVKIYKDYQRRALLKVKNGAVVAMRKPIEGGRKLAARTAEARERARARRVERKAERKERKAARRKRKRQRR